MARMIDADRLLRELTALSHGQVWPGWTYDGIRLLIERQPTLTPPNEWVSVEERLPEDEARQYIEDELDGIGYLYPCLLTYKSPNTERIHVVRFYYDIIQKWFVNNGEELCEKSRCIAWMPLPAPYDRRPPEGGEINKITVVQHLGRLEDVAFRPVSREQVEKVWRGEWIIVYDEDKEITIATCSKCGDETAYGGSLKADDCDAFCPVCGAPMTDEAVEMVMERLEKQR